MHGATSNQTTAMVSILFILLAVVYGIATNRFNVKTLPATIAGIIGIVAIVWFGLNKGLVFDRNTWIVVIGLYIAIASLIPVWIMLQPRDYLSSFLLYAMLFVAFVGVVGAHPNIDAASFPAFASAPGKPIFPILFTTVACGAISGFHSLVSSGTTSKQLDKEKDAKPIAYGGMLLECVLAVLTLCAIAYARQTGHTKGATDIFAGGISAMCAKIPGCAGLENILYTLLVLTYSAFCLTSLDTATRLARFMFQEFWLEPGQTAKDINSGWKKVMVNPVFATVPTVVLGIALGLTGWQKIWGLFGASNQLLAGIGLLAVATWLGNIGKNNKMFYIPMAFMLIATLTQLVITVIAKISAMVMEVLPTGLLRVEGEKIVSVNAEEQIIKISGIVRPKDVNSYNEIDSSKLGNMRVDYYGQGVLQDVQEPGWGTRFLTKLWPF